MERKTRREKLIDTRSTDKKRRKNYMKMDGPVLRLSGLSVNDISHGRDPYPGGTPHCPQ